MIGNAAETDSPKTSLGTANPFDLLTGDVGSGISQATEPDAEQKEESDLFPDSTGDRMFAMDCEMCITEEGFELVRATVVDQHRNVVLNFVCACSSTSSHIVDDVLPRYLMSFASQKIPSRIITLNFRV